MIHTYICMSENVWLFSNRADGLLGWNQSRSVVINTSSAQLACPCQAAGVKRVHVRLVTFKHEHISCSDPFTASRRSAQDQLPGLGAKHVGVFVELQFQRQLANSHCYSKSAYVCSAWIVHTLLPSSSNMTSTACCAAQFEACSCNCRQGHTRV